MDSRILKLITAFESKGWVNNGSIDVASDWWFADIFHLLSTWHPTNKNLYLTLLTDPQYLRKKIVWSVGISAAIPNDKDFSVIQSISLNEINKIDLAAFVDAINKEILIA